VSCRVLQCAAVCCSVLQCVAVCYSVLAVCCSVLQCVTVCCSVLQCVAVCCSVQHLPSNVYRWMICCTLKNLHNSTVNAHCTYFRKMGSPRNKRAHFQRICSARNEKILIREWSQTRDEYIFLRRMCSQDTNLHIFVDCVFQGKEFQDNNLDGRYGICGDFRVFIHVFNMQVTW